MLVWAKEYPQTKKQVGKMEHGVLWLPGHITPIAQRMFQTVPRGLDWGSRVARTRLCR